MAFDTQKQFLANVEDAINSAVDLPDSIDRYQKTLQYARSKLNFVVGHGLYMLPSNMEVQIGTLNGYNNLIQIATDDMPLGYNSEVNVESPSEILTNDNSSFEISFDVSKKKSEGNFEFFWRNQNLLWRF